MAKKEIKKEELKENDSDSIQEERLSLFKSRLAVSKAWCKKPHESWKKWVDEYNIEDISDTEEIRDKVRIGYIFRKTESEIPAIFDDQPDLFIKGRKAGLKEIEPLIEGTYDYLWDIQNLEEEVESAGIYFELLGMGFLESPWVTKTKKVQQPAQKPILDPMTGQPQIDPATGQPQMEEVMEEMEVPIVDNPVAKAENPFKLFFSPETRFAPLMTYENCPYYFKEKVGTVEEIYSRFGEEVESTEKLKIDDMDVDSELEKDINVQKDDLKRVTYWEYYGCLPEDMAKDIKDSEGNSVEWAYDKDYHAFLTSTKELKIEECQYDTKPLFMVGNYGLANKFWKFGEAKHLMPLVQEYQKYRSQMLKYTRKMATPKPLVPTTAEVDEDAFRDSNIGRVVKYSGAVAPSYLNAPQMGAEVTNSARFVKEDLEKQSGTFDLSGNGSSSVKTPRGITVYAEAADRNIRRKRKKIARLIRQLIIFQFQQVAQNWKPEDNKVISIITQGTTEDVKVTQEVLDVLGGVKIMYSLDIETESLSVNKVQQKQDALNLWDSAKERPDIFNLVEIAKDLLQNGYGKKDADRYLLSQDEILRNMMAKDPNKASQMLQEIVAQAQAQQIEGGAPNGQ